MKSERPKVWPILIIVILTLGTYWQVEKLGFINYDDPLYVTDNIHVQGGFTGSSLYWALTNTDSGNWHPVTWLSHMLDCQIFGLDARWHHLINLSLHLLSSILLFELFRQATGMLWCSFLVAILFAIHPLHVESVVWVSERKDVLSTLFMIMALQNYTAFVRSKSIGRYLVTLLSFSLGLMSKPMLVSFPVILLLFDYWPLERYRRSGCAVLSRVKTLLLEKIPFILLSVVVAWITLAAQHGAGALKPSSLIPFGLRLTNSLVSFLRYIGKLFWPVDLAIFYPFPETIPVWQPITAICVVLAFSFMVLKLRDKRPYMVMGWFWYLSTLFPVVGFVQVGQQAYADRYSYIPSIGIFTILAWELARVSALFKRKTVLVIMVSIILGVLSFMARRQVLYWQDSETLFSHVINVTDRNGLAWLQRGNFFFENGRYAQAKESYQQVLNISPNHFKALTNMGLILFKQGEPQQALLYFQKLQTRYPDNPPILNDIGTIYLELGDAGKATTFFRKAVDSDGSFMAALFNLALSCERLDKLDEAVVLYRKVIGLDANLAEAYNGLGVVYSRQGRQQMALKYFKKAVDLDHDFEDAKRNITKVEREMATSHKP